MSNSKLLLGMATVLLGLIIFLQASALPYTVEFGPGPGFAPWWIGVTLIALGVGLAVTSVFKRGEGERYLLLGEEALRAAGIFAAFGISCLLLEIVGFVLAMTLFQLTVLWVFERRSFLLSIVAAFLGSLGVYILFSTLFRVPLPRVFSWGI